MHPGARRWRTAIVEVMFPTEVHSGQACSNPQWQCSLTVICHIAVCVNMVSYVDDGSKMVCVGEPLLSPCLQAQRSCETVTIHALCLSLKQGHFDLGTFKYYTSVQ